MRSKNLVKEYQNGIRKTVEGTKTARKYGGEFGWFRSWRPRRIKGPNGERLFAVWAREGQTGKSAKITGGFTLIPIEGADNARVERELHAGTVLGAWPVLVELAPDAKLELSTASSSAGCAP